MYNRIMTLFAGDVLSLFVALYVTFTLGVKLMSLPEGLLSTANIAVIAFTVFLSSTILEIYSQRRIIFTKELLTKSIFAALLSIGLLSLAFYLLETPAFERPFVVPAALVAFFLLQFTWQAIYRSMELHPRIKQRILVFGSGEIAQRIRNLLTDGPQRYELLGFVPSEDSGINECDPLFRGVAADLPLLARELRAQSIVVGLEDRRGKLPLKQLMACKFAGIDIVEAPIFFESFMNKVLVENISPSWFIYGSGFRVTALKRACKRCFDLLLVAPSLLLILPVFPILALLIKLDSAGPAFYTQIRVGENNKTFRLIKFRSMRQDAEAMGAKWSEENDPRITRMGRFMRKTRLDEVPQLFNVLLGHMSLVGPRPERPVFIDELKASIPFYDERHIIKPGITGWAQVCYPYGSSVEDALEKLRYDLFYIKHLSLLFDIRIILKTINVVIMGKGAR
ncbi:glycosyl transferase [Oceanidesulfovibrio marinus]|uniref:Glycosyl transferase n=2 Tax=Oceanidesulfovibrio marinus TaxID=370038 RepID=A0A6P1ZFK4_9BACT|nr:glycosyl transferase [Oceanidesulfovibrio marinus]